MKSTISIKEVSAYLNVSLATLWRWRQSGIGPKWQQFGGRIHYNSASVVEYALKGER